VAQIFAQWLLQWEQALPLLYGQPLLHPLVVWH
jgi:hypothetical protein